MSEYQCAQLRCPEPPGQSALSWSPPFCLQLLPNCRLQWENSLINKAKVLKDGITCWVKETDEEAVNCNCPLKNEMITEITDWIFQAVSFFKKLSDVLDHRNICQFATNFVPVWLITKYANLFNCIFIALLRDKMGHDDYCIDRGVVQPCYNDGQWRNTTLKNAFSLSPVSAIFCFCFSSKFHLP